MPLPGRNMLDISTHQSIFIIIFDSNRPVKTGGHIPALLLFRLFFSKRNPGLAERSLNL